MSVPFAHVGDGYNVTGLVGEIWEAHVLFFSCDMRDELVGEIYETVVSFIQVGEGERVLVGEA